MYRTIGNGANQIPDMSFFTSQQTQSGYQKLPSGLIIQWGRVENNGFGGTATSSSTGTVRLPMRFPNTACYVHMTLSGSAMQENATGIQLDHKLSRESFSYELYGSQIRFNWFAMGY